MFQRKLRRNSRTCFPSFEGILGPVLSLITRKESTSVLILGPVFQVSKEFSDLFQRKFRSNSRTCFKECFSNKFRQSSKPSYKHVGPGFSKIVEQVFEECGRGKSSQHLKPNLRMKVKTERFRYSYIISSSLDPFIGWYESPLFSEDAKNQYPTHFRIRHSRCYKRIAESLITGLNRFLGIQTNSWKGSLQMLGYPFQPLF